MVHDAVMRQKNRTEQDAHAFHLLSVSEKRKITKALHKAKMFLAWVAKMLAPDRWIDYPSLKENIELFLKHPKFRRIRFVAMVWLLIGAVFAWSSLNLFSVPSYAISQWIQTDWSGGAGSNTTDEYLSATNIDDSVIGEFSLTERSNWFDANWSRRKSVSLTNSGAALTDFQIALTVTYDADMQADFDDIRFANASGTELDYWIESKTDSSSASVWIEVDAIPNGNSTIYLYYGNAGASSASSGANTFIFYDDFETFSGWTTQGSGSVVQDSTQKYEGTYSGHKITNNDPSGAYKAIGSTLGRGFVFEAYVNRNSGYTGGASDRVGVIDGSGNGYGYNYTHSSATIGIDERASYNGTVNGSTSASPSITNSFTLDQLVVPASGAITASRYVSGALSGTTSFTDATVNSFTRVYIFGGNDYWVDAMRIRKHASVTPTTGFGSEEERLLSPGTLTSNIFDTLNIAGSDWGVLNFTTSGSGTVEVRARSSNDSGMSGAPAFNTCTTITSGVDVSSNNCMDDAERYVQYEITLTSSASIQSPVFEYFELNFDASNAPPDTPSNTSPTAGETQVSRTPTLVGSAFSDPDVGDTHADTVWQIDNNSDFSSPEWTRTAGSGEESVEVTSSTGTFANDLAGETQLAQATIYYWRVQYQDNNGLDSSFSSSTSFVTVDPSAGGGGGVACPNLGYTFSINDGAATTSSRDVTLNIDFENATEVIFSEDPAFLDADFQTIAAEFPFTLSEGSGEKEVYLQARNFCRTGFLIVDAIEYDPGYVEPEQQAAPIEEPEEPAETTEPVEEPPVEMPEETVEEPTEEPPLSLGPIVVEEIPEEPLEEPAPGEPAPQPQIIFVPVPTSADEPAEEAPLVAVDVRQPEGVDVYKSGYIITKTRVTAEPDEKSFITNLQSPISGFYVGAALTFASGDFTGETRRVAQYDASTKRITLDYPLSSAPEVDDIFTMVLPSAQSGFTQTTALPITEAQTKQLLKDVSGIRRAFMLVGISFIVLSVAVWTLILYALWKHQLSEALLFFAHKK